MASNFYRGKDKPRYILGHALELGFVSLGLIACGILIMGYTAANKKRDRRMADGGENEYTNEQLSSKGDRAITFRYMM
jgi:hypothetical protein